MSSTAEVMARNVAVADTRFLVRETGSGPGTAVLLLHGVPETSLVWREVQPALATGRRVLAVDLPGLGGSAYSGPFDMPSVTRQVAALIESELPGQQVDVVGHDWGGVVAMNLAGSRPDLVRRLAVANAPRGHVNPLRMAHVPVFALPRVPELLFRLGGARVVELLLRAGWRSAARLDPEVRAEYVAAYSEPDRVRAMLGYYRAAARPAVAALARLGEPAPVPPPIETDRVLVLWGAADPALPVGVGEHVVASIGSQCVMVTIPGAGHFVIEEAAGTVIPVLQDFLADNGEGQAADHS